MYRAEALASTPERMAIRDSVQVLCDRFDDDYWAEKDRSHAFPFEFAKAFAEGGWLGIAMPQEFGGAGLGVTEAAIMMQVVGASAGAFAACSTVHINIFGLHSIVKHGTDAQRRDWLPAIIDGSSRACFGVTEPDAGLDTGRIKTRAVLAGDRYIVHGQKIWTSTAQQADKIVLLARTTPRRSAPAAICSREPRCFSVFGDQVAEPTTDFGWRGRRGPCAFRSSRGSTAPASPVVWDYWRCATSRSRRTTPSSVCRR